MHDVALLVECAAGVDRPATERVEAFGALVHRFQDVAHGCAFAALGDHPMVEDAAQVAFIAAWQHLHLLREPRAFPGWLRRIVLWQCNRLRRGQRVQTVPLDAEPGRSDPGEAPHAAAERAEVRDAVRRALAVLTQRERAVVVLHYLGDHGPAAIARFLEIRPATVRKRLHDARQRLRGRPVLAALGAELGRDSPSRPPAFGGRTMRWI